ncbi:hypothetical protein MW887_006382 [Aspergillus wentii]|nr:hypothetical protein MW887_006382 [Aspergillus wentii]
MHCSTEMYIWEWYIDAEWYSHGVIRKHDMERFIVMDAHTHNKVPSSKFASLPDNAKIGKLFMVFYPALYRHGREGRRNIRITKAVILIRVKDRSHQIKNEINNTGCFSQVLATAP